MVDPGPSRETEARPASDTSSQGLAAAERPSRGPLHGRCRQLSGLRAQKPEPHTLRGRGEVIATALSSFRAPGEPGGSFVPWSSSCLSSPCQGLWIQMGT